MVLHRPIQIDILKTQDMRTKPPSMFKKKFILPYMFSKVLGMFPYVLCNEGGRADRLDLSVISTLLYGTILILLIQQIVTNSMKKLTLLEKLSQGPPETNTNDPTDEMRIFLAKFTDRTEYIGLTFYVGSFLMSLKVSRQMSALQKYFDELHMDIEQQKIQLPGIFAIKKQDPTIKRSVQIWFALISMAVGSAATNRWMQPRRAISISEVYKICKDFVRVSSICSCLEFCVICSMLEFYFVYINSVLRQMRSLDKVWEQPWFPEVLEKVGIWHRTLTRSLTQVNRMFQIQNLLSVISCTVSLLPHLFLVGIRLLGYVDSKEYSIIQFTLAMRYILKIGLRCHFASMVGYEANKTKMHLCRFLMQYNDSHLVNQVKIILQQMSCGNTNFSLLGLFNMNDGFFLAVMLAVVGYFIIILQSYMSEIEDDI